MTFFFYDRVNWLSWCFLLLLIRYHYIIIDFFCDILVYGFFLLDYGLVHDFIFLEFFFSFFWILDLRLRNLSLGLWINRVYNLSRGFRLSFDIVYLILILVS